MNKKILMLGLVVLGILMTTSLVSAYSYNPYPYNPYPYKASCTNCGAFPQAVQGVSPYNIRIGGTFGQNSNYIIGLRPGTYYPTPCISRPAFYYQPCSGGSNWFGGGSNYGYGGGYGYGGYGSNYGGQSPYGSRAPSYLFRGPM